MNIIGPKFLDGQRQTLPAGSEGFGSRSQPVDSSGYSSHNMEDFQNSSFCQSIHKIDPSLCAACTNIICAISENDSSKAVRTQGKPAFSLLVHHKDLADFFICSNTCKICALLISQYRFDRKESHFLKFDSGSPHSNKLIGMIFRDREHFRAAIRADGPWDNQLISCILLNHCKVTHLPEPFNQQTSDIIYDLISHQGIVSFIDNYMRQGSYVFSRKDTRYKGEDSDPFKLRHVNLLKSWTSKKPRYERVKLVKRWIEEFHGWLLRVETNPPTREAANEMMLDALQLVYMLNAKSYPPVINLPGIKEIRGYKNELVELHSPYFKVRVFAERGDAFSMTTTCRSIQRNSNSPDTTRLAKMWIEDCVQNHPECHAPVALTGSNPILPTRVIDVGMTPNTPPKLLESKGQRAKWAALSHRWGSPTLNSRTLQANINQMQKEIKLSALPKTFQDAIKFTRDLGLQYLWIDSLCIIQDSPQDWQMEAREMPRIYQNAYITISAAATRDSNGGILIEREWASKSIHTKLPIPLDHGHGTINLDLPIDELVPAAEVNYLQSRAWCLQESLLSHRLLTFDRLQLSYTCVRHGQVESRDLPDILACEDRNIFLSQIYRPDGPSTGLSYSSLVKNWYSVLLDYTKRNLTFPSDKLVAISGVASILGSFLHDEYYAGIWRRTMPQSLLWSPYEEELLPMPENHAKVSAIYRAPSWSWASMDGSISNFICKQTGSSDPIATIVEASTSLAGSGIYGGVSAGNLKIRGPLKHAVRGAPWNFWPYQPRLKWDPNPGQDLEFDTSHGVFDIDWPAEGADVWCLQITDVYGLILSKTGHREGEYFRLGIFHLRTRAKQLPQYFCAKDEAVITIV